MKGPRKKKKEQKTKRKKVDSSIANISSCCSLLSPKDFSGARWREMV